LEIETMNKFEALKMFQGWPPEWQRLCAEYWAETDEGSDMRLAADRETLRKVEAAWTTADKIQTAGELVQRGVSMPSDQPKTVLTYPREAAKVAASPARNNMRYTRNELIEVDSHVSERRGPKEVARIMDRRYPRQRTIYAWEKMATRISKIGLQAMLERAIDVEFK
jgi:hypothetical protein